MIIDSVLYNGEAETLAFRMRYLWDIVDHFVVVESDHTFSGNKKKFCQHDFSWAERKLVWHSLYTRPKDDPWENEFEQRNHILKACKEFSDGDILLMGDVDEIPSYESLGCDYLPSVCQQFIISPNLSKMSKYYWNGTIVSRLEYARKIGIQNLRNQRVILPVIIGGGWHLTYFGGAQSIKYKLESFSHQELNKTEYTIEYIEKCIDEDVDIFGGEKNIGISEKFYPDYFLKHTPENWREAFKT